MPRIEHPNYKRLIGLAADNCMFASWTNWTSCALEEPPRWQVGWIDNIEGYHREVIAVVWPGTHPELEAALIQLANAAMNAATTFAKHAFAVDGQVGVSPKETWLIGDRIYKKGYGRSDEAEWFHKYDQWLDACMQPIIEATKAANWLADIVRRDMDSNFHAARRFCIATGGRPEPSEFSADQRRRLIEARSAELGQHNAAEGPVTQPVATTNQPPAIIVLLTVNDNETDAVFDAFHQSGNEIEQVAIGGVTYNKLGMHGGMEIVHAICEMGAGGIGAAQQRTSDVITHWEPAAVIAVGIAFGIDETKQNIGDVLVATQLRDYELSRVNADGNITLRADKGSTSDPLRNRLRTKDAVEKRRAGDWPKVRFGQLLCGQKLIDNVDYRESLKRLEPEAIGGEMEGVGVYVSASRNNVDWIVVKAICDWGHNKNSAQKDTQQKLAAKNAATVLKAALDVGPLY